MKRGPAHWWRDAVVYQIYPRSWVDSNGDGVGDLPGVSSRLDYLVWLGIDTIWLNPTFPSPNADWGYDVADYRDVHPDLGTLADLDRLVAEAGRRGIRVLLDLVPNHTSDRHPWFVESRASRSSHLRDWYVWADPKPVGSPPNNWRSAFRGPAWTLDERTGHYYLHQFLPEQPDLNWWNDGVRDEFDATLRVWLDRGVAGFRIDVANALVKDRELRDDPPAPPGERWTRDGLLRVHSSNRPEVHDVYRRWRAIVDAYDPPRLLLGEAWVRDLAGWAAYSVEDELHSAFAFHLLDAPFGAPTLRSVVEKTEAVLSANGVPAIAGSNHDVVRMPTRWCGDDGRKVRCALLILFGLRGTPVLYYGDEIGMTEVSVPPASVRDPAGRDGARTPMQWSAEPGHGFTTSQATPWLPFGNAAACNVAAQQDDPSSLLSFCRAAIALRRSLPDLRAGVYASLPSPHGVWAWRRGERVSVVLNLSDKPARVEVGLGTIALGTDRERDGERVESAVSLQPWEGAAIVKGRGATQGE